MTAKGFRGFVVEFNTYNIPAVESPVTYPFLAGRTSIIPVEAAEATADSLPALLIITGHEYQKSRTPYVKIDSYTRQLIPNVARYLVTPHGVTAADAHLLIMFWSANYAHDRNLEACMV